MQHAIINYPGTMRLWDVGISVFILGCGSAIVGCTDAVLASDFNVAPPSVCGRTLPGHVAVGVL
jgi:hypothetical protein